MIKMFLEETTGEIETIVLDFEIGAINAFKDLIPEATFHGCNFHLGQSWFKALSALGLRPFYLDKTATEGKWLRRVFLPFRQ